MKISIITPTHNPKFLRELEETIIGQTYSDWEWIIMLNQGAKFEAQSAELSAHGKIKIIECPFVNNSVGFLKRLACMQAMGKVIAEVDHDDLLVPDCLEKLAGAFGDPEIGFVYSRNAKLTDKPITYLPDFGWKADRFKWGKKNLYSPFNQPLNPARLGHIYFAPDHIRAWRRDVYESIGGHDDSLKICDDLDLMHRLYLATKFKEIPEVLYIYRITGDNTYLNNGKSIGDADQVIYERNIAKICRRLCELNGLAIVDMSSNETDFQPGVTYPDNSVGLILADDCLQFVEDKMKFMAETHRVLAPGGMLLSCTPSTEGNCAWTDPRAKSFWNETSFWGFTRPGYARRIGNEKMFFEARMTTGFRHPVTGKQEEFDKKHGLKYVTAHLEKL